jgi:TonB family protein
MRSPEIRHKFDPPYPDQAIQSGISGTVKICFVIDTDGTPSHFSVTSSLGDILDADALNTAKQWQYIPAINDAGRPVRVWVEIPLNFTAPARRESATAAAIPKQPPMPSPTEVQPKATAISSSPDLPTSRPGSMSIAPHVPRPLGISTGVPPGSRVYIAPMEGQLDGFIAPEFVKQHLPLVVVLDEKDADYVLAGASLKEDSAWYHVIFGGKDKNEGNVRLLDVRTRTMVWAGEAGDRTIWYGNFHRGGQRKVADRIVSRMKKDLFR